MRIGPLELQIKQQKDGSWRYRVVNTNNPTQETVGYRPTENQARNDGLSDAFLMRQFC